MVSKVLILAALLAVGASASSVAVRATNNYYFSSEAVTFPQAWAYCKNADMNFVSLPTAAQNSALTKAVEALGAPTTSFYVGGIYLSTGFLKKWFWVDGQEDFSYANWSSPPSPSTAGDNCVIYKYSSVTKNGTWTSGPCTVARYFICQI